jgi:hypothetical protein
METAELTPEQIHREIVMLTTIYEPLASRERNDSEETAYQNVLKRTKELQDACPHTDPPGITSIQETGWTGVCRTCHKAFC